MGQNLKRQYELRFRNIREYRNEAWKILAKSVVQPYIPVDSHIIDVGSGWGEFINNIEGKRRIGIDFNADAKQHLEPSVEFICQDCSQRWPLSDNSLDVVFTSNFLEHLPDKSHVEKTIQQASRCLKPNGRFICLGPNIKYLPGAYWDFWDHHVALTDMSLSEVLEMNDFRIEKCIARFLPYTMARNHQPPLLFLRLYLAFPLAWRIFGKQFLLIAQNEKYIGSGAVSDDNFEKS